MEKTKDREGFEFKVGDQVRALVSPHPGIKYTAAGEVRDRMDSDHRGRLYFVVLNKTYPGAPPADWYPSEKVQLDAAATDFAEMEAREGSMAIFVAVLGTVVLLAAAVAWFWFR